MRSVIASDVYRSGHIGAVIASYSYCYNLIDQSYYFYSLSLFRYYVPAYLLFTSPIPLSKELEGDLNFFLADFAPNTCTLKTKYSIESRQRLALKRYSGNLCYILRYRITL